MTVTELSHKSKRFSSFLFHVALLEIQFLCKFVVRGFCAKIKNYNFIPKCRTREDLKRRSIESIRGTGVQLKNRFLEILQIINSRDKGVLNEEKPPQIT